MKVGLKQLKKRLVQLGIRQAKQLEKLENQHIRETEKLQRQIERACEHSRQIYDGYFNPHTGDEERIFKCVDCDKNFYK